MNKILISIFILLNLNSNCDAQSYFGFSYDPAGNRISREFYLNRLANPNDSTMEDPSIKYGINVYPNPTTQSVNISIPKLPDGIEAKIEILDEAGKQLFRTGQRSQDQNVDLSLYSAGIYFIHIRIENENVSYRLQKN